MTWAYSTWRSVRFPSGLSSSCSASTSRLLSGVRSSWDMFAMNSDLYFEETESSRACSSTNRLASSTSWYLPSTSLFFSASRVACSASSALDSCSCSWRLCSSSAWSRDCSSSLSLTDVEATVLSTMPMLSASWSRSA